MGRGKRRAGHDSQPGGHLPRRRVQGLLFPALFEELEGSGEEEALAPLFNQLVERLIKGSIHDRDRAGEELLVFSSDSSAEGGAQDGAFVARFRIVGADSGFEYGGLNVTARDRSRSSDYGRELTALMLKYGLNGRLSLDEGEALRSLLALPSQPNPERGFQQTAEINKRGRKLAGALDEIIAERRQKEERRREEQQPLKLLELLRAPQSDEASKVFLWLHEQLDGDPVKDRDRAGEELAVSSDVFWPRPLTEVSVYNVTGQESGDLYTTVTMTATFEEGTPDLDDQEARRLAEARALLLWSDLNGEQLSIPDRDHLFQLLEHDGWVCSFCPEHFRTFAIAVAHELKEHGQTAEPHELP